MTIDEAMEAKRYDVEDTPDGDVLIVPNNTLGPWPDCDDPAGVRGQCAVPESYVDTLRQAVKDLRADVATFTTVIGEQNTSIGMQQEEIDNLREDRDSWRRVAERLEGEKAELRQWESVAAHFEQEVKRLQMAVNGAYRERAMLVALLAALWPSTLSPGQDEDEWSVVHIDGPVGQMGWHIAPEDLDLFEHVRRGMNHWDGHDTPEKFRRIRETTALLTTEAPHE